MRTVVVLALVLASGSACESDKRQPPPIREPVDVPDVPLSPALAARLRAIGSTPLGAALPECASAAKLLGHLDSIEKPAEGKTGEPRPVLARTAATLGGLVESADPDFVAARSELSASLSDVGDALDGSNAGDPAAKAARLDNAVGNAEASLQKLVARCAE